MTGLVFDEAAHRYFLDGVEVPSVSKVIAPLYDWSGIDRDVLNAKAALGTAVHLAAELDDAGELDEDTVDEKVAPYLQAWRDFVSETEARVVLSEQRLAHRAMKYAGTLDRVLEVDGRLWLVDLKTGTDIQAAVGVQLAAYENLLLYNQPDLDINSRFAVQLRDDGTYRLHEFKGPDHGRCFAGLLAVHNWKEKNK